MHESDLRIFIGPTEIANINAILADALKQKGAKVTVVTIGAGPFQDGMKYDKVLMPNIQRLNRFKKLFCYLYCWGYCFVKYFPTCNTFIFQYGDTLLPFNLDLPILKIFNKCTIMQFVGDDIRYYRALEYTADRAGLKYYMSQERLALERKASQWKLRRKKLMLYMVEKFATHILSAPQYSQLLTRPYHTIDAPVDISNIRYNNNPNSIPIVIHAPSEEAFKGTTYIVKATERLKQEGYQFEFRLLRGVSNAEVRKILSEGDIAVDQLFAFGAGMFAIEAMASGCAVLGGNVHAFSGLQEKLPVIHTNPDNIYQNLKMLLEDPDVRRVLGEKGRQYVERYHDPGKIADDYIRLIVTGEADTTHFPVKDSAI